MSKTLKKRFDILVTDEEGKFSETFELDKDITAVKGLLLASDRDDLLYFRGSQKIQINSEEIFPEDYESKLLMSGINVAPGERFYDLGGVGTGNRVVKVEFKDNQTTQASFEPYRVSLYLDCITN
ncbi:MAG TPA: hypothetical protein VD905_19635 [Flavobacteriales bacterium]|nr:hypothetical protein [Flavobacteriales bacterium]